MLRRLMLNVVTAFSLVLCVAALAMWARSVVILDELSVQRFELTSYPQQLMVSVWNSPEAFPVSGSVPAPVGPHIRDLAPQISRLYDRLVLTIPCWIFVLGGLPLPVHRLRTWLHRRRLGPGFPVAAASD